MINTVIFVFDRDGRPVSAADAAVRTETEAFDGGFCLYVSACAPGGFDPDRSIVIRPRTADTGDYLAIVNHSPFWCRPFWGESFSDLPERTQELLVRNPDGSFVCFLPLCGSVFKTVIRGCDGGFEFRTYSNCSAVTECVRHPVCVCTEGPDPDALLRETAQKAAALLGGLKLRGERSYPEVLEYLGWCSWDAMHIHVSHDGLLRKAREFREKNVPVRFAVIDDMWADVPDIEDIPTDIAFGDMVKAMHAGRMNAFAGSPRRFPQGMAAAVADLKAAGIPEVGLWFPTTGYWSGFLPEGPDAAALGEYLAPSAQDKLIAVPTTEKAGGYFDALCARVKAWGGDFVKIDNQGCHGKYREQYPIGESSRAIQTAIDAAADKYFGGALINCMGMPSECMFHRPSSAVSRCSDDFQPESREWFSKNILQCAYNGLLQGRFYVNDWDMWWTDDEQAVKNSVCRALSGGPVYVSDPIGRTVPEVLKPVIMSDGCLLRCEDSAVPAARCLMEDPTRSGRPFLIRNVKNGAGLAAAFNIDRDDRPETGTVSPADAGLPAGRYAWYEYFTGACGLLGPDEALPLSLPDRDTCRLYTFVPCGGIAVLGRTDKYIGVGAVTETRANGFSLLEGGPAAVISERPLRFFAGSRELNAARRGNAYFFDTGSERDIRWEEQRT